MLAKNWQADKVLCISYDFFFLFLFCCLTAKNLHHRSIEKNEEKSLRLEYSNCVRVGEGKEFVKRNLMVEIQERDLAQDNKKNMCSSS